MDLKEKGGEEGTYEHGAFYKDNLNFKKSWKILDR